MVLELQIDGEAIRVASAAVEDRNSSSLLQVRAKLLLAGACLDRCQVHVTQSNQRQADEDFARCRQLAQELFDQREELTQQGLMDANDVGLVQMILQRGQPPPQRK